jgi:hypothetical protein
MDAIRFPLVGRTRGGRFSLKALRDPAGITVGAVGGSTTIPTVAAQTKADAILTPPRSGEEEASLLDILDHVLNAGVVLHGSVVISVAGVDLVYLGLNAVLTSVETALKHISQPRRIRE